MLFGPEDGEPFRYPHVDGRKAVETGVAGRADGDQEIGIADAGMTVVNVEAVPRPAAGAAEVVALEHRFPVPAKVVFRIPTGPITLQAQPTDRRDSLAAGAEERLLPKKPFRRSPQEAFRTAGEG
jgi:hypothetical protein